MISEESGADLFQDAEEEDLICVEWPEAVNLFPQFRKRCGVQMRFLTDTQREVIIEITEDCDLGFFMEKDYRVVLLKDIEFVCLDCETTGLDVKKDRVIEFAAIRFTFDEVIDSVEFLIHPERAVSA